MIVLPVMLKQSFKLSTVNSGGRNAAMSFVMDAQPLRFNSFTVEGNALRAESGRLMQPVRSVSRSEQIIGSQSN